MKHLLFAAALLLGFYPACAQTGPASGAPTAPVAGGTHADSLAVLHRVFRKSRRIGRGSTFLFAGYETLGVVNTANRASDQSNFHTTLQVISLAAYAGLVVDDIVQWARFSQRREASAVRQFEEGQPLPLYVQQYFKKIFAREMARQHRL